MGIIMERLNSSIQQLQDSVVSAYENVSAGIVENAKSSGIAGLDSTFEIFSDSKFIAADANLRSAVSEPAAYPGPVESLAKDSPILQTLQDQGFRPEREIASLFGPGWDKGSGWLNQLFKSMKLDKLNSDRSIDGELADGAARKQAKGPVSDVVPDPPVAVPPSVIPTPQKTYLQTIDQTAEQMQINPQPETAHLLQQQFSAVEEMTSAVKESLQLFQQLNSNLLFVR